MRTILVDGASTAAGWYDMEHGGWANRLRIDSLETTRKQPQNPVVVMNRAFPGKTLPAVTRELTQTVNYGNYGDVRMAVSVGLNEAKIYPGSNRPIIPLPRFRKMVDDFAEETATRRMPTVYVGIQPLGTDRIETQFGNVMEDDLLEEYDDVLRQRANADGMPYVSTRKLFVSEGLERVLDDDGYHPNATGHEVLRTAIWQALNMTR